MACALLDLRAVVVLAAAFSLAVSQTPVPVRPSGKLGLILVLNRPVIQGGKRSVCTEVFLNLSSTPTNIV